MVCPTEALKLRVQTLCDSYKMQLLHANHVEQLLILQNIATYISMCYQKRFVERQALFMATEYINSKEFRR